MSFVITVVDNITTLGITESPVVISEQIAGIAGAKGDTGSTGPTGATGATGATGSSGVISVTAPITNSGTSTAANIGINAGVANGVATLDGSGLIPTSQLPPLAVNDTFVVASQAAMLALTAQIGDIAVRTDVSKTFILSASPASTLANWQEILTPPGVTSVTASSPLTGGTITSTGTIGLGTVGVANGGTGQTTLATGEVLIGAGTSGVTTTAVTTTGGGSALVKTGANGTIQVGTNITVLAGVNPTAGSISFNGASSGSLTLQPSNSSFGSVTHTLPTQSGTVTLLDVAQTLTNKTISGSSNSFSNIAASAITSVNGSAVVAGVTTITGTSYTVASTDYLLICNNSAALTITLPSASSSTGRILKLVKYNASSVISASSNVGNLNAGTTQNTFFVSNSVAGKFCEIISNGTIWQIVANS